MSAKSRALKKLRASVLRAAAMTAALKLLKVRTGDTAKKIEALNKSVLKIEIGESDGQD